MPPGASELKNDENDETGRAVRVMTYNINAGRYHADGLEAVAKVIEAANPDIAGIQEVDRNAERTGRLDQAGWLAARLQMHAVFGPALRHADGGEYGVALLTRNPVVSHLCLELPHVASEELRNRMPATLRHHADEARAALAVTTRVGGRVLHAIVTHFGLTSDQRLAQAEAILDIVKARSDDEAVVLLGDLNARPDSPELITLTREMADACAGMPDAFSATRRPSRFDPQTLPEISRHIDYVLTSRGIAVQSAGVIRDASGASDHMPVVSDLLLAWERRGGRLLV